ncbi:nucleoside deaminase [Candidatus Anaplasma sp. TIGMIC]|uniref:nucleoside deaminase n=1 Tax=Candidatus Anaplasma sp. TIGMIC TaxID=3020713 RepID=UPI003977CE0D
MKSAMEEARLTPNEVPVGAVIVKDKVIISRAHNLTVNDLDPTAHAEILAIRRACSLLSSHILSDCDMYVTLEPCAMCAQAISFARIRRLYFGAYNEKLGGVENGAQVFKHCTHVPEVYGGFFEQENSNVLKEFFQKIRSSNSQ